MQLQLSGRHGRGGPGGGGDQPLVSAQNAARTQTPANLAFAQTRPHPPRAFRPPQVRLLNKVAMTDPLAVTNCNIDLENLIADPNRSIATLAITTLLKTGSEGSVDRLLKQIGTFMTDIADEFKIVVVEAIRALCLKFPQVRFSRPWAFWINREGEGGGWIQIRPNGASRFPRCRGPSG